VENHLFYMQFTSMRHSSQIKCFCRQNASICESIGEWGALVGGKVSRGPLANGLDHWAMALYWWVAHRHSPMTGLVGGLEQTNETSFFNGSSSSMLAQSSLPGYLDGSKGT
jgi:hypothetical protein